MKDRLAGLGVFNAMRTEQVDADRSGETQVERMEVGVFAPDLSSVLL